MGDKQGAGDWLDQAMSFLLAALATFFALVIVWALTETFTPLRVQPMALRYAMVAAMALAALAMGVRAGRRARARRAQQPAAHDAPAAAIPEDRLALAKRPPSAPAAPADARSPSQAPIVAAARLRPIVFRETYPPPADAGLSFYGGAPCAPRDFKWPRAGSFAQGAPLHFVMQWDCAELSRVDPTGLTPKDGALYLFCDLSWGDEASFRFVHAPGPAIDWAEASAPADLGPVFGDEGAHFCPYATPRLSKDERAAPRLLPRWPFKPVAIDYPPPAPDEAEDDEDSGDRLYWSERPAVAVALLAAQNGLGAPLATWSERKHAPFARPYPAFPQDWATVRVVSVAAMEALHQPQYLSRREFLPELDDNARLATAKRWFGEAAEEYGRALRFPPGLATTQADADEIWASFEKIQASFEARFPEIVETSVNVTLGLGGEGARAIPAEHVARNAFAHMLAFETGSDVFATTPNHMFGPPSYVQGDVEEFVDTHLLLLELSSSKGVGIELGEGVLQFMIAPDDLRAARFDRVRLVRTGY